MSISSSNSPTESQEYLGNNMNGSEKSTVEAESVSSELQDNEQVLEYAIRNDPNIKIAIDKLLEGVTCLNQFVTGLKNSSSSSMMKLTCNKILQVINQAQINCRVSCKKSEDDTYQLCKDRKEIEKEISKQRAILQSTSEQITIKEKERTDKKKSLDKAKDQLSNTECTATSAKNRHNDTKALALISNGATAVACAGLAILTSGIALPVVTVAQGYVAGSSMAAYQDTKNKYEQATSEYDRCKYALEITERDLEKLERKIESLSKDLKSSEEKGRRIVDRYESTMKSLRSVTKLIEYLREWQFSVQSLFSSVEVLNGTEIHERLRRQLNMLVVDIYKKLDFISKTRIMKNKHSISWNGNEFKAKLQIGNNTDCLTDEFDAYI